MSGRQHEPVAIHPGGVCRVVFQNTGPQHIGRGGEAHGCTGVPGICRLHGIHRQGSDRIDTHTIDRIQALCSIFLHNPLLLSGYSENPLGVFRRLFCF